MAAEWENYAEVQDIVSYLDKKPWPIDQSACSCSYNCTTESVIDALSTSVAHLTGTDGTGCNNNTVPSYSTNTVVDGVLPKYWYSYDTVNTSNAVTTQEYVTKEEFENYKII